MGFLKRLLKLIAGRPAVRVSIQAAVSVGLLSVLIYFASQQNGFKRLQGLDSLSLAVATALHFLATTVNSARWQVLLRNVGIQEPLGRLTGLYMIGQFFSLFLPTSAGGDAARIYDVARRTHKPAETIVATLQERLLALGAILVVGLAATAWFLPLLPGQLQFWVVLSQLGAAAGIGLLLYPALFFATARWLWQRTGERWGMARYAEHPLVVKVLGILRPMAALPPLRPFQLIGLFLMALGPALMFIGMYYAVGRSLGIQASFAAYCLAVPLVSIIRMLPVSLNGYGVGEVALASLLVLFEVPKDQGVALALAMLALLMCLALCGGLALLVRIFQGNWNRPAPAGPAAAATGEAAAPPSFANGQPGEKLAVPDGHHAPSGST